MQCQRVSAPKSPEPYLGLLSVVVGENPFRETAARRTNAPCYATASLTAFTGRALITFLAGLALPQCQDRCLALCRQEGQPRAGLACPGLPPSEVRRQRERRPKPVAIGDVGLVCVVPFDRRKVKYGKVAQADPRHRVGLPAGAVEHVGARQCYLHCGQLATGLIPTCCGCRGTWNGEACTDTEISVLRLAQRALLPEAARSDWRMPCYKWTHGRRRRTVNGH